MSQGTIFDVCEKLHLSVQNVANGVGLFWVEI